MPADEGTFLFDQIHIDVARNVTDDFNPFHDPARWRDIRDNPFSGPIALGFQLEALAVSETERRHAEDGEAGPFDIPTFPYESLQVGFAGAVLAGDRVKVQVKRTNVVQGEACEASNRFIMRQAEGREMVLMGTRRLGRKPLIDIQPTTPCFDEVLNAPDRHAIGGGRHFLKRKYLTTSNAKNFCVGAWIDQRRYVDELEDRIDFPALFVVSLSSCALLEMAWSRGHDFTSNPLVYTSHKFSVDRGVLHRLRSNQAVNLLVDTEPRPGEGAHAGHFCHLVTAMVEPGEVLFVAELWLMSLEALLQSSNRDRKSG